MRMDVYFLGLLFGIFLRKCKDGKITWAYKMKWYYQLLGWTMAIFFLVGSLFGPHVYYNHDDPHYYSQAQFKHNIKSIISAIFLTIDKELFIILRVHFPNGLGVGSCLGSLCCRIRILSAN